MGLVRQMNAQCLNDKLKVEYEHCYTSFPQKRKRKFGKVKSETTASAAMPTKAFCVVVQIRTCSARLYSSSCSYRLSLLRSVLISVCIE